MTEEQIQQINAGISLIKKAVWPPDNTIIGYPTMAEEILESGLSYVGGRIAGIRQAYHEAHNKYAKVGSALPDESAPFR